MEPIQKKMSQYFLKIFSLFFILFSISSLVSMVEDNKFIFRDQWPFLRISDALGYCTIAPFYAYSGGALRKKDNEESLLDLWGPFNEGALGRALGITTGNNPLADYKPSWANKDILWITDGKIQMQGLSLFAEYAAKEWLSFGFSTVFLRVNSSIAFERSLDPTKGDICEQVTPEDRIALDRIRRQMISSLCLSCGHSYQIGFGDIDVYVRFGRDWDYVCKLKHIDFGFRIGALLGTGKTSNIYNPLSIPFGGNGHYGIYGQLEGEFEIKEDLTVGLLFRMSKRFKRTYQARMPVCTEPQNYGATVGDVCVNPGVTFVFSPYVTAENLRDGLGFRLRYTLTEHLKDGWTDKRPSAQQACIPVCLSEVEALSRWGSDYVSLSAFYDFGQSKIGDECSPVLFLTWDLPMGWLVAKQVSQTKKITLGLEFNF